MKLTLLLSIMAMLSLCSKGYGQITLKENKASLEKVLADIEIQTKYVFLYDPDEVKTGTITIDVKNATLQVTLEKCFKSESIEFTLVGNNVLLKKNVETNRTYLSMNYIM